MTILLRLLHALIRLKMALLYMLSNTLSNEFTYLNLLEL